MKKSIFILEDNADRRETMRQWLDDRLSMYELVLTDDPDEFIQAVQMRLHDILAISLDHDLHERPDQSTTLTGMLVVDFLTTLEPAFPVLLHTSNDRDGERMRSRLIESGWNVQWVVPFAGTKWIANEWYHTLKRAIRKSSKRELVSLADDAD